MKRSTLFPYVVWMALFIIVPMVLVLYYAFTVPTESGATWSLENFARFFEPIYLRVLWRSLRLAVISTVICLVIGYPAAMVMSGNAFEQKHVILLLFVVPMWMNFLLRTYAWLTILERNGVINVVLNSLNLPSLNILYTEGSGSRHGLQLPALHGAAYLLCPEQD